MVKGLFRSRKSVMFCPIQGLGISENFTHIPREIRPRLREYAFIENDIGFNENAIIVLHLRIVFVSFSAFCKKTMKAIENGKNQLKYIFACQDNLNNLWLLLHRFQKLAFSVKTIRLHNNDIIIAISFSNLSTLETVSKSYRFQ